MKAKVLFLAVLLLTISVSYAHNIDVKHHEKPAVINTDFQIYSIIITAEEDLSISSILIDSDYGTLPGKYSVYFGGENITHKNTPYEITKNKIATLVELNERFKEITIPSGQSIKLDIFQNIRENPFNRNFYDTVETRFLGFSDKKGEISFVESISEIENQPSNTNKVLQGFEYFQISPKILDYGITEQKVSIKFKPSYRLDARSISLNTHLDVRELCVKIQNNKCLENSDDIQFSYDNSAIKIQSDSELMDEFTVEFITDLPRTSMLNNFDIVIEKESENGLEQLSIGNSRDFSIQATSIVSILENSIKTNGTIIKDDYWETEFTITIPEGTSGDMYFRMDDFKSGILRKELVDFNPVLTIGDKSINVKDSYNESVKVTPGEINAKIKMDVPKDIVPGSWGVGYYFIINSDVQ